MRRDRVRTSDPPAREGGSGRALVLLLVLFLGACGGGGTGQGSSAQDAALPLKAVIVAGDGKVQAFDNGVVRMRRWLADDAGVAPDRMTRLSASPAVVEREGVQPATAAQVTAAIETLRPATGQGCFVFITSHGLRRGVTLPWNRELLTPGALDSALTTGCGGAPTIAIISACYSGTFALPPMQRDNRIILTAARADRPSFGCGARSELTFFDRCLLDNLGAGRSWPEVYTAVRACVGEREAQDGFPPSEPQIFVGRAVEALAVPGQR